MDPTLRTLTVADWEMFREIRLRALAEAPDAFGSTLAFAQAQDDAFWRGRVVGPGPTLVLTDGDRPVAVAGAFVLPERTEAMVWGMWTEPASRRRGHGDRLLRALTQWADGVGVSLVLHVTEGNAGARALYVRHGFAPTGRWEPLRDRAELRIEEMRRTSP